MLTNGPMKFNCADPIVWPLELHAITKSHKTTKNKQDLLDSFSQPLGGSRQQDIADKRNQDEAEKACEAGP